MKALLRCDASRINSHACTGSNGRRRLKIALLDLDSVTLTTGDTTVVLPHSFPSHKSAKSLYGITFGPANDRVEHKGRPAIHSQPTVHTTVDRRRMSNRCSFTAHPWSPCMRKMHVRQRVDGVPPMTSVFQPHRSYPISLWQSSPPELISVQSHSSVTTVRRKNRATPTSRSISIVRAAAPAAAPVVSKPGGRWASPSPALDG